jgi:predicted esterase
MIEPTFIDGPPDGLSYRYKVGAEVSAPAVMMLHGKTGDENVMWVLEGVLPRGSHLVAPRGLFPVMEGGFHWINAPHDGWPEVSDFQASAEALFKTLEDLKGRFQFDRRRLVLMGFSQGAALAFAATALGILQPGALVALAGFLPKGKLNGLKDLPIFWGHGSQDEMIPIENARMDVEKLLGIGADVHYCEADVGHKLGAECARGLNTWLLRLFPFSGLPE